MKGDHGAEQDDSHGGQVGCHYALDGQARKEDIHCP